MKYTKYVVLLLFVLFFSCSPKEGELPSYLTEEKEIEFRVIDFEERDTLTSFSKEEAREDLEEFIYILKTAYAGYEYQQKFNNVHWNSKFRLARRALEKMDERVSQRELGILLFEIIRGSVDGHLSMTVPAVGESRHYSHKTFYFSQIWVEKVEDSYIVVFSDNENIHPEDRYTGSEDFLFPAIKDSRELYRVGVLSWDFIDEMTVKINRKNIQVPVSRNETYQEDSNRPFAFSDNQDIFYIKIIGLMVSRKLNSIEKQEQKQQIEQFEKRLETIEPGQKLILDLRNNHGGYAKFLYTPIASYLEIPETTIYPAGWNLVSPYILQYKERVFNNYRYHQLEYNQVEAQENAKEILEMWKHPHRYWEPYMEGGNEIDDSVPSEKQIFVLVNRFSASAAEILWAVMDPQRVCLIGENTAGVSRFIGPVPYTLKNSRIVIYIPNVLHNNLPHFEDEYVGVFPDYWQNEGELGDTLSHLLGVDARIISPEFTDFQHESFNNGDFEWNWNDGFMGWNFTASEEQNEHLILQQVYGSVPSGESCLKMELVNDSWASLSQTLTVKPHSLYRISGQFRLEGEPDRRTGGFFFSLGWPRQETAVHTFPMEEWQEVECYIDSGEEEEFLFKLNAGSEVQPFCGDFYADNIKLERVDAVPDGVELIKL